MRTGNKIVDAMANVNISGNVISPMWYRTVVKDDGKPHFLAIAILSDVVYWYRPRIVRDEATGNVIRTTKRFADDLLQRGSKALAEQFGVSKRQITEALRLLEELNVISRHYRTIERAYGDEKVKITNIQYIELHVDVLKKLSELPQSANENCANGMVENSVGGKVENYPDYEEVPEGETQNYPMLGTKLPDPPTQNRGTNTEITAETTTEITTENRESIRAREKPCHTRPEKIAYADDVLLTETEYSALIAKLGSKQAADECIEILSNYKGATGRKYKSDYKAILNWVVDKYHERHKTPPRAQPGTQNDPVSAAARVKALLAARQQRSESNANGYSS